MASESNLNEIDFGDLFKKLNVSNDSERSWARMEKISFEKFYEYAKNQPISSFIRLMELKCRSLQLVFHEFFNIDYGPSSTNTKTGSCFFFPEAERFRIILPPNANEDEVRNIVAHEIGHLYCAVRFLESHCAPSDLIAHKERCREFLRVYLSAKRGKTFEIYENRANIIGIFILNERSKFYKHRLPINDRFFCKTCEQITDDFVKLKNKILSD